MKKIFLLLTILYCGILMNVHAQYSFNICGHVISTGPNNPADGATLSGYITQSNGSTIGQFSAVTDSMGNYCTSFFSVNPDTGNCAFLTINISASMAECNVTQTNSFSYWLCNDTTILFDISGCDNTPPTCSVYITDSVALFGYLGAWSSGTAPFVYQWSNGNGSVYDTAQYIYPNAFGQYCVNVTDANGCMASACYYYGQNNCNLSVMLLLDSTPCTGPLHSLGSAVYGANNVVYYSWSTGDSGQFICNLNPGTYCLQVSDGSGCTASACYEIQNTGNCTVSISENTDSSGANYLLAVFSGTAPDSYQWQANGAVLSTSNPFYPPGPGDYCVVVGGDSGCTASACYLYGAVTCSVMYSSYAASDPDSANWVNFTAYPYGVPPFTFSWSFSDGTTTQSGTNFIHYFIPSNGWAYACVEVTDATGCMSSYCDYVAITDSSNTASSCFASFSGYFDDINGSTGQVFFTDYSWGTTNSQVISWNWNFGDGTNSTLQNPSHTYSAAGNFNICLTITDASGCTSTYCETWYVDPAWWGTNPWGNGLACDAQFIATQDSGMPGMVYLVDLSYGNNLFYTWSFVNADGTINQTISSQYPFISFDQFGCFNVCLQITDTLGNCQDYFCDTLCVDSTGTLNKTGNWGLAVIQSAVPVSLLSSKEESIKNPSSVNVFPNPAGAALNLKISLAKSETVHMELVDFTGRIVNSTMENFAEGTHNVTIDLKNYPEGVYFIRLDSENLHHSEKIVKLN